MVSEIDSEDRNVYKQNRVQYPQLTCKTSLEKFGRKLLMEDPFSASEGEKNNNPCKDGVGGQTIYSSIG